MNKNNIDINKLEEMMYLYINYPTDKNKDIFSAMLYKIISNSFFKHLNGSSSPEKILPYKQDIIQDVIIDVIIDLPKHEFGLIRYIDAITHHKVVDISKKVSIISLDDPDNYNESGKLKNTLEEEIEIPEETLDIFKDEDTKTPQRTKCEVHLKALMPKLKQKHLDVLVDTIAYGFSYEEISKYRNIPYGTVENIMKKKKILKNMYLDLLEEEQKDEVIRKRTLRIEYLKTLSKSDRQIHRMIEADVNEEYIKDLAEFNKTGIKYRKCFRPRPIDGVPVKEKVRCYDIKYTQSNNIPHNPAVKIICGVSYNQKKQKLEYILTSYINIIPKEKETPKSEYLRPPIWTVVPYVKCKNKLEIPEIKDVIYDKNIFFISY